MNRHDFTLMLAMLTLMIAGCASPEESTSSMEKTLANRLNSHWQEVAQHMAARRPSDPPDVIKQPFPDVNNPLHREIWNALSTNGLIGAGYGFICNYHGTYLVTVQDGAYEGYLTSCYMPKYHFVGECNYQRAFRCFTDTNAIAATPTNAVLAVRHILAVDGFNSYVVNDPDDIPHKAYTEDNPNLLFKDMLLSKGIVITPPRLTTSKGDDYHKGYEEFNVYVYKTCGGEIYRYEVLCRSGLLSDVKQFVIANEIGDCSYIY